MGGCDWNSNQQTDANHLQKGELTSVIIRNRGIYKNVALLCSRHGICMPLLALDVKGPKSFDKLLVQLGGGGLTLPRLGYWSAHAVDLGVTMYFAWMCVLDCLTGMDTIPID